MNPYSNRNSAHPTVFGTGQSEPVTLFYENFDQIMLNLAHYLPTSNIFVDLFETFFVSGRCRFLPPCQICPERLVTKLRVSEFREIETNAKTSRIV